MDFDKEYIGSLRRKLRLLEREIGSLTKSESICCGVTLAQCHVLMELSFLDEVSVKELAQSLDFDKSNLSRTIDSLVKSDLVFREPDQDDRRFLKVGLTTAGRDKVHQINHLCNNYYKQLLNVIPEEKLEAVVESIEILADAMNTLRKSEECCKIGECDG